MKTGYKVCDAMTKKPITVTNNTTLVNCAKLMAAEHVGALLVKDGDLDGIVTEQDIVRSAIAKNLDPEETTVEKVMENKLITISPSEDIYGALMLMKEHNIRHLPVTDDKKMVGLLTIKDILKIEPQLFDLMVEKFELREESMKPINKLIPDEGICQNCGEYAEKLSEFNNTLVCAVCAKNL